MTCLDTQSQAQSDKKKASHVRDKIVARGSLSRPFPPWMFCTVIVHEIIMTKSMIHTGSISDKKAYCTKREFLELFYENYYF